ncbi:ribonuclease H family protein [Bacillus sp. FJAT-45350]|uniref:ribonuclease H family protein n=1 Tax=Bacillus sp. FJAT-45350 TaxID=2011014 RepID=UPI000BB92586|nr:ribonuclease H family protein [Bacillus sp. FJAT-45350]
MKVRIEWQYKTTKGKRSLAFTSDFQEIQEILFFAEDIEKTGRVKELVFVDEQGSEWLKKDLEKYIKSIETEPHNIVASFDGGYNVTDKEAGVGFIIHYDQSGESFRLRKNQRLEQLNSNNEAEYAALWNLLLSLEELGAHHIPVTFKGDSLVVINQLNGEWPCYEEELNRWLDRIEEKVKQLGLIPTYEAVSRKENKAADHLATQALEGVMVSSNLKL